MENKKIIAIFTADWHFRDTRPRCRIDDYFEAQGNKLFQIKELQRDHKCPIFDCGDLLNNYRSSPFLEGWLIDNLPDSFHTIAGNHDLPNHRIEDINKSSLGVLIKAEKISLLRNITLKEIDVYGFDYDDLNHFSKEIEERIKLKVRGRLNIALIHEFVSMDKFPGSYSTYQIAEKLKGFDFIFSGHNHINFEHSIGNTHVINIGSQLRMDADQIDHEPGFYVMYDDFTLERKRYIIKDNVIDRKYIDDKKDINEKLEAFITSLNGKYEVSNNFKNNIDNHIKENNIPKGIQNKIYGAMNESF